MKKIEEQIRKAIEVLPFLELKENLEIIEDTIRVKVTWESKQAESLKEFGIDLESLLEKTVSEQVLLKATEKLFSMRETFTLTDKLKKYAVVSSRIAACIESETTLFDSDPTKFNCFGMYGKAKRTRIFVDPIIPHTQTHVCTFDIMPSMHFTLKVEKTDTSIETCSNYNTIGTENMQFYNFPEHLLDRK